jgi:hypothetical protein
MAGPGNTSVILWVFNAGIHIYLYLSGMHLLSSPTLDYHALSYCHHVRCLLIYQKLSFLSDLNRGGGIGGLTLAVALSRIQPSIDFINNVEVDIYEASSQITQIGTVLRSGHERGKFWLNSLGWDRPYLTNSQVKRYQTMSRVRLLHEGYLAMVFIHFIQVLRFSSEKVTKIMVLTYMTLFLLVKFCQLPVENLPTLNPLSP